LITQTELDPEQSASYFEAALDQDPAKDQKYRAKGYLDLGKQKA